MTTSGFEGGSGPAAEESRPPGAVSDGAVRHLVVVNDEEQYSIWPASRPVPAGWRPGGVTGSKAECLDHIATVWTDMRPASLR
jgi:MbtH protein